MWGVVLNSKSTRRVVDHFVSNYGQRALSVKLWTEGVICQTMDRGGYLSNYGQRALSVKLWTEGVICQTMDRGRYLSVEVSKWWLFQTMDRGRYLSNYGQRGLSVKLWTEGVICRLKCPSDDCFKLWTEGVICQTMDRGRYLSGWSVQVMIYLLMLKTDEITIKFNFVRSEGGNSKHKKYRPADWFRAFPLMIISDGWAGT